MTGTAEAEATVRSQERYARIRVRIEPPEQMGLELAHALAPDHELFDYWQGVLDGVRLASCSQQNTAMRVVVLDAVVHPVDSRRTTFALATRDAIERALQRCAREEAMLDRSLFPWVATILEEASVALGAGMLKTEPLDVTLEQPLSWSCRWPDVDPAARTCVESIVRDLTARSAPHCNAILHFATVLSAPAAPSATEIRAAVDRALASSRVVERHVRAMSVRDLR